MIDVATMTEVISFIIIDIVITRSFSTFLSFLFRSRSSRSSRELRFSIWQCKALIYFSWVFMRCSSCFKRVINVFRFNKFSSLLTFSLNMIRYVSKLEFNILRSLNTKSSSSMIFKSFHFDLITIIFKTNVSIDFSSM